MKYRFLVISCVQTLFFQAFNKKMSFVAFPFFSVIFHVLFLCFHSKDVDLTAQHCLISVKYDWTWPGIFNVGLSIVTHSEITVTINSFPGWKTQSSAAIRTRETCRD